MKKCYDMKKHRFIFFIFSVFVVRIFTRQVFSFNIGPPGKGSKYREFPSLSGRITCTCMYQRTFAVG